MSGYIEVYFVDSFGVECRIRFAGADDTQRANEFCALLDKNMISWGRVEV